MGGAMVEAMGGQWVGQNRPYTAPSSRAAARFDVQVLLSALQSQTLPRSVMAWQKLCPSSSRKRPDLAHLDEEALGHLRAGAHEPQPRPDAHAGGWSLPVPSRAPRARPPRAPASHSSMAILCAWEIASGTAAGPAARRPAAPPAPPRVHSQQEAEGLLVAPSVLRTRAAADRRPAKSSAMSAYSPTSSCVTSSTTQPREQRPARIVRRT